MPIAASEATKLENLQSIVNQLSICGISEISGETDSEGAVIMIITEKAREFNHIPIKQRWHLILLCLGG